MCSKSDGDRTGKTKPQINTTMKTELIKSWDNKQVSFVKKQITKYLNSRYFETFHSKDSTPFYCCKSFSDFDNVLGLAYTSSSDCAGLWICNTDLYLDASHTQKIIGFGLDKYSFVYLICWDDKENEMLIPIN